MNKEYCIKIISGKTHITFFDYNDLEEARNDIKYMLGLSHPTTYGFIPEAVQEILAK